MPPHPPGTTTRPVYVLASPAGIRNCASTNFGINVENPPTAKPSAAAARDKNTKVLFVRSAFNDGSNCFNVCGILWSSTVSEQACFSARISGVPGSSLGNASNGRLTNTDNVPPTTYPSHQAPMKFESAGVSSTSWGWKKRYNMPKIDYFYITMAKTRISWHVAIELAGSKTGLWPLAR